MIGIQGSGKTTLARQEFPDHAHVSLDIIKGFPYTKKLEIRKRYTPDDAGLSPYPISKNRQVEYVIMRESLDTGRDVLVDDTNVTRRIRLQHICLARRYGAEVSAIFFTNIQRAYSQNQLRKKPIPKKILDRFHRDMEIPHMDEGFESIRTIY